jgi:hemerythrin superfamily protein
MTTRTKMQTTMQATGDSGLAAETDVVAFLIGQHMAIRDLFTEVTAATGEARADAFERLVKLLAAHETAEEQVIRPATRGSMDGGAAIADARIAEERQATEMLVQLERLGPDGEGFLPMLENLRAAVLLHAHNEEAYEFRYLKQKLGEKTGSMTAMVKAAEAIAPTHPHPRVNSATANNIAGPVVSLFDRTRDLVRKAMAG